MMTHRKTLLGLTLVAALSSLLFFPLRTLEVRSRHADRVLFRQVTAPGDVFTFAYIHSIEKVPVEGVFAVEADGALRVVETRFPSYGAGLPFQAMNRSADGRWMIAPGGGQRIPEFSFFVSPINQASLRMGAETLDLTTLVDPGDVVSVTIRRYPYLLMRLWHKQ